MRAGRMTDGERQAAFKWFCIGAAVPIIAIGLAVAVLFSGGL